MYRAANTRHECTTQSHYPDTGPSSPDVIRLMLSVYWGNNQYIFNVFGLRSRCANPRPLGYDANALSTRPRNRLKSYVLCLTYIIIYSWTHNATQIERLASGQVLKLNQHFDILILKYILPIISRLLLWFLICQHRFVTYIVLVNICSISHCLFDSLFFINMLKRRTDGTKHQLTWTKWTYVQITNICYHKS